MPEYQTDEVVGWACREQIVQADKLEFQTSGVLLFGDTH